VNSYVLSFKTTLDKVAPDCQSFKVVIHADRKPAGAHSGRYNAPAESEVALVIVGQQYEKRDVITLHNTKNKLGSKNVF